MRVAMIGTGYVGLVSGACFADFGHEVICVDKDKAKIAALGRGDVPIYEPGLNELVAANAHAGRLKFTTELAPAVKSAEAVFIAVGVTILALDIERNREHVWPRLHPGAVKRLAHRIFGR